MKMIRVLVYEGNDAFIASTMRNRVVKGSKDFGYGRVREIMLFPEDEPDGVMHQVPKEQLQEKNDGTVRE